MKKYTRLLRFVLWFLVLAWMALIFCFSMENADESSSTSGAVIRWLLERFDKGFPTLSPAEQFAKIEGERFEYETNMLLQMKRRGIPFSEQEIETVYEDENAGSHYDTLKDSWRIFRIMCKAAFRGTEK